MKKSIRQVAALLPNKLKDSFRLAFAILGGTSILLSFTSLSLGNFSFILQVGIVIVAYVALCIGVFVAKCKQTSNAVTITIRGMKVVVKEGDIFKAIGWKLIPFNEYFDTQVDDVVIAHNSLNGKYIDSLTDEDREALQKAIVSDDSSPLSKCKDSGDMKTRHELGTIKVFGDVMMLALTHFNEQNEAYSNRAEYEQTLRKMWREIYRTYQARPINIPLIGGGLTRLEDMTDKPNEELLRCILCTLRTSTVTFAENATITIYLTKKALETIDLYELKGEQ